MIPTPTHINFGVGNSPQQLEITVYNDDYSLDITSKCTFEFVNTPPAEIKIVKNKISADKKAKYFYSQIRVRFKEEEKFITFALN